MTEPEWRLWFRLKGRALGGAKFLRQHPVGPYVVDFCCREAKLVVEVDGWTHATSREVAHDSERTGYLVRQGYRVMRFHNDDLMKNLEGMLAAILVELDV